MKYAILVDKPPKNIYILYISRYNYKKVNAIVQNNIKFIFLIWIKYITSVVNKNWIDIHKVKVVISDFCISLS